jgi:hypothetical protein
MSSRTITGSTFSANTAGGGGGTGFGGAIDTGGGTNAEMNITNTTFTGNSAGGGGGTGFGGAVDWGGGTGAAATLTGVTLVSNSAGGGGGTAFGGGWDGDTTTASNTILADNLSNDLPGNCQNAITSGGHNIENGTTCGFTDPSDQNVEPALAPIGDYGGPTQTRALLPNSLARDHGAGCPATDQRGQPRPFGPACDIGAYEFTLPGVTTGTASNLKTTSALLSGSLLASLRPAIFHFDYGKTTTYGSQTAAQTGAGSLSAVTVSSPVTGLKQHTTYHYRLVVSGDDTVSGKDATFTTPFAAPALRRLRLSPSSFPAAPAGGSIAAKRKTGTNISYTATQAGKTTFKVLRPAAGRRQGKSCRKPSARNRRGRKCTRLVVLGKFSHKDKAGKNKLHFTGRVHRHALALGKYRLRATPRAHGKAGKSLTARFKIIL